MTDKERAEAHWNGYVGPMMRVAMDAAIEMSKFHYISSHIHGSKHGVFDEAERAKKVSVAAFAHAAAYPYDPTGPALTDGPCIHPAEPAPPAREALDLTLPDYALPCTAEEARNKCNEEIDEWVQTAPSSLDRLIEAWDIRQAVQTWSAVENTVHTGSAMNAANNRLNKYYTEGLDVMKAKRIVMIKLAARARYSPEDCARILADV